MIKVDVKRIEGDNKAITGILRKWGKRSIYRAAGFQRSTEMNSMKDAPKGSASPAGSPPHSHAKTSRKGRKLPTFKNFIRFSVNNAAYPSAVVGPTKGSDKHHIGGGRAGRGTWSERIGKTHEFGGRATVEKRVVYIYDKTKGQYVSVASGNSPTVLWKNGKKTFSFQVIGMKKESSKRSPGTKRRSRSKKDKRIFKIRYQADYPKRPFAFPALLKTTQKMRDGGFGLK